MDNKYVITQTGNFISTEELYHWGIKGMKWGVRRYQNPDGSLTAAGRKRYTNPDGSLNEIGKKKLGDSAKASTSIKKSVKDMTDEELDKAIMRARKEDEYNRLRPEIAPETNKRSSRKLMSKLVDEMVVPAVINSGRNAMQKAIDKLADKYLKDAVDPNSYEALKKQYDLLKIKKDLENLKNPKLSWDDKLKKQQYDENERKREKKLAEEEAERIKAEGRERVRKQQERDKVDQVYDGVKATKDKDSKFKDRVKNAQDSYDFDFDEDGRITVEGEGTSRRKSGKDSNSKSKSNSTVIDSDKVYKDADGYYRYRENDSVNDIITPRNTSAGSSFVSRYNDTPISGLLPPPKDDDD